jgi:rhodanese-related sulfurtransferase
VLVLDLLTMSSSRVRAKRTSTHPDHALTAASHTTAQGPSPTKAGDAEPFDDTPLEVDFASLDEARDAGYDIVDIREPQELKEIPTPTRNARHIPMAQLLHGNPAFTPTGKTLLVCASGRRSLAASQELRARGLKAIYSLRGGVTRLNRHATA